MELRLIPSFAIGDPRSSDAPGANSYGKGGSEDGPQPSGGGACSHSALPRAIAGTDTGMDTHGGFVAHSCLYCVLAATVVYPCAISTLDSQLLA